MSSNDPPLSPFDTLYGDDPYSTRPGPPPSTGRRLGNYRLLREIGRGGMGVVYEAVRFSGGTPVALKTLQKHTGGSLRQFKDEFRVLADLAHHNLVRLGELVTTESEPFFTMELLSGVSWDEYVRASFDSAAAMPHLAFNEERLRDALFQLADGLSALHAAGCVHRDLKPSNVFVTREGRVVILDFGLALDEGEKPLGDQHGSIAGTPYYMSPEQTQGHFSIASDWYSVGVMLYEALTGERAFSQRRLSELMQAKMTDGLLRPREVLSEIPEDLDRLCRGLLSVDPSDRPDDQSILSQLRGRARAVVDEQVWIGRDEEMRTLQSAWDDVQRGHTRVVLVSGHSGMGKTSIVDRFLTQLRRAHGIVVLRGRCYENESVAYQGFDSIVDSLSALLQHSAEKDVDRVLPMELDSLCQIFPVLGEVPSVAREIASRRPRNVTGGERRRIGFAALRELLCRLTLRTPLVIFIDDLQQGDADTAALFREVFWRDKSPQVLFVGTFRSEDASTSQCIAEIRRSKLSPAEQLQLCDQIELTVNQFGHEDAVRLTSALLAPHGIHDPALAQRIASESCGDPLFIRMLTRHLANDGRPNDSSQYQMTQWSPGIDGSERWTLASVIANQIDQLAPVYRSTLELLAAAGRPIEQETIEAALGDELPPVGLVRSLRAQRLVRRLGDHRLIETFHDKIRETVREMTTADRLQRHCRGIAIELEKKPDRDVEFIADLYRRGGELVKSGEYYVQAAAVAVNSLAFNRAVEYYQYALAQLELTSQREGRLRIQLADALANASRSSEAAREYLAASKFASGDARASLHQSAALRWLTSGHVDEGIAALQVALQSHHLPWPRTTWHAVLGLLKRSAQLRFRGLHPSRRGRLVDDRIQERLDVCWSAAAGLSVVDPVRGSFYVAENLYQSLSHQGSRTLVRDLAAYIGHVAIGGNRSRRSTHRVLVASRDIARQDDNSYARAMLSLARGIAALLRGDWSRTIRCCDRAGAYLQDGSIHGATWELSTARTFALWALQYQGNWVELARRQPELMRVAREADDLFATLNFGTQVMTHLQLAVDKPDEARERLAEDEARLSDRGFFVQHHNHLLASVNVRLYQGNGVDAADSIDQQWGNYRKAFLSQVQQIRVDHFQVAARANLAAACAFASSNTATSSEYLAAAKRHLRRLYREKVRWSVALASAFDASVARIAGDVSSSRKRLAAAIPLLERVEMRMHAAAARHHLARLDCDESKMNECRESWRALGIVNPEALASMLIPGFEAIRNSG